MALSITMSLHNKVHTASNLSAVPNTQMDAVYKRIRKHFSYFDPNKKFPVFLESAGASLCPNIVIDSMANYMRSMYVQIGAGYELSMRAKEVVDSAHKFMKTFVNGDEVGEVAFGSSSSQLLKTLSHCYVNVLKEGDEVIVHEANQEANAGPWVKLAEQRGLPLKFWKVNEDFSSSLESLGRLISNKTRIVAVAHVSNVLGEILDLERVVKFVRDEMGCKRAIVIADGVAFAPHRAIDVAKWGVDWYAFSTYKVCGPHMAVLFGTHDAFNEIKDEMPNFYFIPSHHFSSKFELGCLNHEACAGILALQEYLQYLAQEEVLALNFGSDGDQQSDLVKEVEKFVSALEVGNSSKFYRELIEAAFRTAKLLEEPLQMALINYLKSRSDVRIVGPANGDGEYRVPTISFVHMYKKSSDIAQALYERGIAIRSGHMYSHRLISALCSSDLLFTNDVNEGVVRISMIHYNTPSEVAYLISCLNDIL
jgi:selenocysteine lyase/cysteine desulfurase